MPTTKLLTWQHAGGDVATPEVIAFGAGEDILLSLTPAAVTTGADRSLVGRVLQVILAPTQDEAAVVNCEGVDIVITDAVTGLWTAAMTGAKTFALRGGVYKGEVRDVLAGSNVILRRFNANITANPLATGLYKPVLVNWAQVTGKPTTLAGYGITDAGAAPDTGGAIFNAAAFASLQAAVNAANAVGGGTVLTRPGVVTTLTSQLTLYDNIRLEATPGSSIVLAVSDIGIGGTGLDNVELVGLRISGTSRRAIAFTGSPSNIKIRDCDISGATLSSGVTQTAGVYLEGSTDATIEDCYFHGNGVGHNGSVRRGGDVIAYGTLSLPPHLRITLRGNRFHSLNAHYGASLINALSSVMDDNDVNAKICDNDNSGYGLMIYNTDEIVECERNRFTNNRVYDTEGIGIYNQSSNWTIITDNNLTNCATTMDDSLLPSAAIGNNGGSYVVIGYNIINGSGHDGICIAGNLEAVGTHCGLDTNTINDVAGSPIRIRAHGADVGVNDYTTAIGNKINNSTGPAIRVEGITKGLVLVLNPISGTAGLSAGISLEGTTTESVINFNPVIDAGGRGVYLAAGSNNQLIGNTIKNCSRGNPGVYESIYFASINTMASLNKTISDTALSNMTYGVYDASAGTGNSIFNNDSSGHTVAAVGAANPTVTKIFNNNLSLREISGVLTSDLPFAGSTANFTGAVASVGLTNTAGLSTIKSIANTNTAGNIATFGANSTGTVAAGFGSITTWSLETTTTNNVSAMDFTVSWNVPTHGSQRADAVWSVYGPGGVAQEVMHVRAGGAAANIGFLGADPQGQQSSPDLGAMAVGFGFASGTPTFGYANMTGLTAPLASGFVFNFGGSDTLITHSANTLTVRGNSGMTLTLVSAAAGQPVLSNFNSASGNWQCGTDNAGNGTGGNQFFWYQSGYHLTIQNGTGYVGIGTTQPTEMLFIVDGGNIGFGTTTGTKLGATASQKVSTHGATPVIQRASAAQAAVITTAATNITPYGFATQAQADAIVTLLNELRAALVAFGPIKGSS